MSLPASDTERLEQEHLWKPLREHGEQVRTRGCHLLCPSQPWAQQLCQSSSPTYPKTAHVLPGGRVLGGGHRPACQRPLYCMQRSVDLISSGDATRKRTFACCTKDANWGTLHASTQHVICSQASGRWSRRHSSHKGALQGNSRQGCSLPHRHSLRTRSLLGKGQRSA